jgi:aldose 1-epimerase
MTSRMQWCDSMFAPGELRPRRPMMTNPFSGAKGADEYRSFNLSNASGMSVTISERGAALRSWRAPDRYGRLAEVLLVEPEDHASAAGARAFWHGRHADGGVSLMLAAAGGANLLVNYRLDDDGGLTIEQSAMAAAPTPLTVNANPFFKLNGGSDLGDHILQIHADYFVEIDAMGAPLGVAAVERTPFDFRQPAPIGPRLRWPSSQLRLSGEFDHCFFVRSHFAGGQGPLRDVASVFDPRSGLRLQMSTTEAALQFCTDSRTAARPGDVPAALAWRRGGFGLEATPRPDLMNEAWPHIILQPRQAYRQTTVYRISPE